VQNLGNTVFDGVQDFVGNQGLLDSGSQDFLDSAADFVQQNTNNAINFGQEIFPQISETTQNVLTDLAENVNWDAIAQIPADAVNIISDAEVTKMLTDFGQIAWNELGGYVATAEDVLSENIINVYEEAVEHVNAIANDSNFQFLDNIVETRNNLVNQLQNALENGDRKRVYNNKAKYEDQIVVVLKIMTFPEFLTFNHFYKLK